MKVPVVNREDYILYLEYWDDTWWFHTDVNRWTANVFRNYVYHLDLLQHLLNQDLYAIVVDDPKLAKFGKIIGFNFLEHRNTVDGNIADIYIRSK
jgi:hypothetical protein